MWVYFNSFIHEVNIVAELYIESTFIRTSLRIFNINSNIITVYQNNSKNPLTDIYSCSFYVRKIKFRIKIHRMDCQRWIYWCTSELWKLLLVLRFTVGLSCLEFQLYGTINVPLSCYSIHRIYGYIETSHMIASSLRYCNVIALSRNDHYVLTTVVDSSELRFG